MLNLVRLEGFETIQAKAEQWLSDASSVSGDDATAVIVCSPALAYSIPARTCRDPKEDAAVSEAEVTSDLRVSDESDDIREDVGTPEYVAGTEVIGDENGTQQVEEHPSGDPEVVSEMPHSFMPEVNTDNGMAKDLPDLADEAEQAGKDVPEQNNLESEDEVINGE